MSIYAIMNLITIFCVALLTLFVFFKNPHSKTNQTYALYGLSVFVWGFGALLMHICKEKETALIAAKIVFSGGFFIALTGYHFSAVFVDSKFDKKIIPFFYILNLFFLYICNFTNLFVNDMYKYYWGFYPKGNTWSLITGIFYYIFSIRSIYILFKQLEFTRGLDPAQYSRTKYVFAAMTVSTLAGLDYVAGFNIQFYPPAHILTLIMLYIIAYAIVRHQLMDIKVVIKKTLIFAGLLVSAFAILVLPMLLIQEYLFSGSIRKILASIPSINIYYSSTGLINGIASTLLGLFVYFKNKKASLNRTYALFALSVSVWSYFYIFWPLTDNKLIAFYSFRLLHLGANFIPVCYFHFILVLLNKVNEKKQRLILNVGYILSFILVPFLFTNLMFEDMVPKFTFKLWAEPGILYPLFLLKFFFFGSYSLWLIYVEYKKVNITPARKTQLKYVLISFLIAYLGGSTNFAVFYNIPIMPIWNICVALYMAITAYAIIRHQLMDIKVIVRKTLVFTGLLAFVFMILVSSALLVQKYFISGAGTTGRVLGLVISGIVIIFSMRRIENFIINLTDKYLFQKKYDYKELLNTFTTEVLTVLDLNRLVNLTVDKLMDIIRLNSCAVLLLDKERDQFNVAARRNIDGTPEISFAKDDINGFLEDKRGYCLIKETAELVIPMVLHEKVTGMLFLGKKKSDEDYTQDDLGVLLPLARTLAIAISNAELFDELGKTQAEAAQKEKMAVIGTLAAGMAHEIRNPITTIKVFSEFLKERKDDPDFVEKFERIVPREVDKINHMIMHLLEFSRPADYRSMESVDIKDALKDVLDILGNEMAMNDIVLEENINKIPPVCGNKKYIQEVLFNLVQNAIHAIGKKGKVAIAARDDGDSVCLRIRDTGCGMAPESIKHIFEPFFTTKLNEKGVGLGLYVIKQLMLRMGGNISVESEPGAGATFTLNFKKFTG